MRVALVSDVHGNAVALDAVLDDVRLLGAERTVCLGDVAQGGPQPAEVLDRLAELEWPVILGNADDFLLRVRPDSPEPVSDEQLEVRAWSLEQLEPRHLAQIESFAPTLELELDGVRLLAFHGSPRSYDELLFPESRELAALDADADVLAGGHTHLQWTCRAGEALFVNPGSVGLAYDRHTDPFRVSPLAEWALLHTDGGAPAVEFRRVPFDVDALVAATRASGRPHADAYAREWLR